MARSPAMAAVSTASAGCSSMKASRSNHKPAGHMSGPEAARLSPMLPLAFPSYDIGRRSMTETEIADFVTRFAAGWAARDGEAFLALWHPDGLLHTPLVGRPVKGS